MKAKALAAKLTGPGRTGLWAGAALACGLWALSSLLLYRSGGLRAYLDRPELGSYLLAGLPNSGVTWSLPLFGVLAAGARACGAELPLLLAVRLALYLLVFAAGRLFRGQKGGLLALAAAGAAELSGAFTYDAEQSFYSLTLLALLCAILLYRRQEKPLYAALAGLCAGISLLARSPLFFFPPLLVLAGFIGGGRGRAFFARAALFLAASYALLLPWGALNRSVSGGFSLLDTGRAASNLAAGSAGSVYTMNGNPALLAVAGSGGGTVSGYLRAAAQAPGFFALTVLRRAWAVLLFHPVLIALFIAAFAFSKEKEQLLPFALPVYFLAFHAFFPVEERYFYPLLFLLPPLLAAPLGQEPQQESGVDKKIVLACFALLLCAALAVDVVVLVYPGRAARNSFNGTAPAWLRGERTMRELECRTAWAKGDYAAGEACFRSLSRELGDNVAGYYLVASVSVLPAALPLPRGAETECLIIRMLREFELGGNDAALASYRLAYANYGAVHSMLRGAPYARDKELEARLQADAGTFWDAFVYPQALRWPPERLQVILPRLAAALPVDGRLLLLADALADKKANGSFGWRQLREWTAPAAFALPRASLRALWRGGAAESAGLAAAAAVKEQEGDGKAAEALLRRALEAELNPDTAGIYLRLCRLPAGRALAAQRLRDCRAAAFGAYFAAESGPPADGAEASFRAYELLKGMGRGAEARTLLRRAVDNAPEDWPGLMSARKALGAR
jgi:hypothetical protein